MGPQKPQEMDGRELRRSYTQMEFPTQRGVKSHYHQSRSGTKQRNYGQQQKKQLPTQEIYRPPNPNDTQSSGKANSQGSDGIVLPPQPVICRETQLLIEHLLKGQREGGDLKASGKLNVHAKEFAPIGSSNLPLQSSKSTGSLLAIVHNEGRQKHNRNSAYPLTSSKSSIQTQYTQVGTTNASTGSVRGSHGNDRDRQNSGSSQSSQARLHHDLQRSKSTTSAVLRPTNFSMFGKKSHFVESAYANPGGLRAPVLLELAKIISEKAQENRAWAESLASLSFYFIEREKQTTFIEGLMNMLQYIVEKKCRDGSAGDTFYFSFFSFLHSLYGEIKPQRIEYEKNGRPPAFTLLTLLVEVCIDFLRQENLTGRKETESLFFVVTTIGRDLESDCPRLMESLMSAVRDAFLSEGASAPIRRTLLQLVELKAARWQLPARTIHYYQTYLTAA